VLNRRIAKTAGGVATLFVYDREDVLLDFSDPDAGGPQAASLVVRYLHGPEIDMVLAEDRGGSARWLLTDHLGTTRDVIDNVGAVVNHVLVDAYGNVLSQTNPAAGTRYVFTGRELDTETGLYYYRARYYDPTTGRFLSEDPSRLAAGDLNLLRYVGNSPVMVLDPTGRYGTNDCSYYQQRCEESGGSYYCETAQYYCDDFFPKNPDPLPDENNDYEGWTRCVRQCLQDCDAAQRDDRGSCSTFPDPATDSFWDWNPFKCHVQCYVSCAAWGVSDVIIPPAY
jgi:RHS repeat-associated protein